LVATTSFHPTVLLNRVLHLPPTFFTRPQTTCPPICPGKNWHFDSVLSSYNTDRFVRTFLLFSPFNIFWFPLSHLFQLFLSSHQPADISIVFYAAHVSGFPIFSFVRLMIPSIRCRLGGVLFLLWSACSLGFFFFPPNEQAGFLFDCSYPPSSCLPMLSANPPRSYTPSAPTHPPPLSRRLRVLSPCSAFLITAHVYLPLQNSRTQPPRRPFAVPPPLR